MTLTLRISGKNTTEGGIDMALVTTRAQQQKQNEEQLSLTQQADEEVVLSNPEVRNMEEDLQCLKFFISFY